MEEDYSHGKQGHSFGQSLVSMIVGELVSAIQTEKKPLCLTAIRNILHLSSIIVVGSIIGVFVLSIKDLKFDFETVSHFEESLLRST